MGSYVPGINCLGPELDNHFVKSLFSGNFVFIKL